MFVLKFENLNSLTCKQRWLKECTQLTLGKFNFRSPIIDDSLVIIKLFFFSNRLLNFKEFIVLDTEPGFVSEFTRFTFAGVSYW
jgi:hypothetical protein